MKVSLYCEHRVRYSAAVCPPNDIEIAPPHCFAIEGSPWFEKLCRSAIEIPGPEIRKIADAAARHRVNLVVGVNERNRRGVGTLYNTLVTIADDGRILGRHRKMVPTWAEKLTWAPGDASALRVHDTSIVPLVSLACCENPNALA